MLHTLPLSSPTSTHCPNQIPTGSIPHMANGKSIQDGQVQRKGPNAGSSISRSTGGLARGMNLFRCAHLKRAVAVQQIPVQGTPLRHTRPKVPASGKSEGAPKHSWQRRYTSLPTWVTASPETSPEKGSQCGFLDLRIHRRG